MMKRSLSHLLLVVVVILSGFATTAGVKKPDKTLPQSYLLVSKTNTLSPSLQKRIQSMGGTVTQTLPQIGAAVIETTDPRFQGRAAAIPGVQAVLPNLRVQWVEQHIVEASGSSSTFDSGDNYHYPLQWNLQAVRAPEAWAKGYRGEGALVAVLDTGFDVDHPDLVENIDFSRSRSMLGDSYAYALDDMFSHGTHIAGIIAAADNDIGTIGVAPKATLMLVKVLDDNGTGAMADVLGGIVYAADQRARVINLSLAAVFDTNGFVYSDGEWLPAPKKDILEYRRLMSRAVTYANSRGALVVAAAGNQGWYRSNDSTILILPADAQNAIGVSATGPDDWLSALLSGQSYQLDHLALYSNYGPNLVDVAAPGGDYRNIGDPTICAYAGQVKPCWVYDMVLSTGYSHDLSQPAYYWMSGTSMAAAHASGVLALLIGKNSRVPTGQATTRLYQSADDLEPPGKDMYFGSGRVNAAGIVK